MSNFPSRLHKSSKKEKPIDILAQTPDKDYFYNHACHTCALHFPTESSFSNHMLYSPAHKSFKLANDIAEELGYLDIFEDTPSPTISLVSELGPCTEKNCACPRFQFALPKQPFALSTPELAYSLDGAAGSTLQGEKREDKDEGDEGLNFNLKRPHSPEEEDIYKRPVDSDDEEVENHTKFQQDQRTKAAAEARRKAEEQAEMRQRFNKGKHRKAARLGGQKTAQEATFAVYEAYAAADETLFGQRRIEEVTEEPVEPPAPPLKPPTEEEKKLAKAQQDAAVADWQGEMGWTDYEIDAQKAEAQLTEEIDLLINDVLFEVSMRDEEELRRKTSERYKSKLFFKDTLEDVVIDHEFRLADEGMEKYRKVAGAEWGKAIRDRRMEDIVDDIAMDHVQEVGEKEEERYRRTMGKIQGKELMGMRMGDVVDDIAMDHIQEVGEKEEDHHRKTMGRTQGKNLTDARMEDMVDELAMDHTQEVGEKEQEQARRTAGRGQNNLIRNTKMDDIVDDVAMDHLQEAGEKSREYQRKSAGLKQTQKQTDIRIDNLVDNLAMDHFHETGERSTEHHRKSLGMKQSKQLVFGREDHVIDTLIMDHMHEVGENEQEHNRMSTGRQQNKKLTVGNMENMIDNLVSDHIQNVDERVQEQQRKASGRRQTAAEQKEKVDAFLARFLPDSNDLVGKPKLDTEVRSIPMVGSRDEDYNDGLSSPVPIPKTARQKRKETNARHNAIIEDMVRAQEENMRNK